MNDSKNYSQEMAQGAYSALTAVFGPPFPRLMADFQYQLRLNRAATHPNPLVRKGHKYFSQNDEDGILLEIIDRLGLGSDSIFVEFGVGNGLENNTIILLSLGWRGLWIGGNDILVDHTKKDSRLAFSKAWVTRENAVGLIEMGLDRFGTNQVDVLSVDLDGNDIYVLEEILSRGFRPKCLICEYNGKFPPPIDFKIKYNPSHNWDGSDYFGASLQAFVSLLSFYGYKLVACNMTGANAFFVDTSFSGEFNDVPESIFDIFVPAHYGLIIGTGQPPSPLTINAFL